MALIERAHSMSPDKSSADISVVGLPINSIVDYDLANYKLSLRSDFDLNEFMEGVT